jgi:histidyl-tRNA synthetase
VAGELREGGLAVRPDGSSRKLGKQLESAAKAGARWAVIVGEELERGEVGLKDLESGEQRTVPLAEAITAIGG